MVEQEENLKYVCITRAMSELVFLDCAIADLRDPGDGDEDDDGKAAADEGSEADGDGDEPKMGACRECGESLDGLPVLSIVQHLDGDHQHLRCDLPGFKGGEPELAPLPPVDADAPDTYDPRSHAARQALARRLDAALREQGFAPTGDRRSREVIYSRARGELTCKVYSTIVGGEARAVGKDSIKVALVRDGKGVGSTKRVNRVGKIEAVVGRVKARIEQLHAR